VARAYALASIPTRIANDADLAAYLDPSGEDHEASYAGRATTLPNGVVMSYLELGAGAETTFHRTVSVDFTILIEGQLEMELDSGQKIQMKPGVSQNRGEFRMLRADQGFPGHSGTESDGA
jgi:hypothetical protein